MRVQGTVPVIVVSMARKKHRQTNQQDHQDDDRQNISQGVDDQDESSNVPALKHCVHINKSVNPTYFQKSLKKLSLGQCSSCAGSDSKSPTDNGSEKPDVYMCLQCGYQGCDRSSPGKHALCHYQTAHSNPHDIAINLSTLAVWCYACDDFVATDVARKLKECIDLLRRQTTTVKKIHNIQLPVAGASEKEGNLAPLTTTAKQQSSLHSGSKQSPLVCSKVKGFANLGNTCFFNAVMQNLCQTHLLDQELREWTNKGKLVELVAPNSLEKSAEPNSDNESEQSNKDCLTIRLPECGPLTQSLLSLFDEVTGIATVKQRNYVSPSALFNQVCHKAPRFKGFQQQDSHELLRYLLDGMKAEEIKRSQIAILKAFNFSEQSAAKDFPEDKKLKVKEFGRSAKHTFVDQIFGGVFISTVVCQTCRVPTQVFEPFLDVSLPIADEKSSGQVGKSLSDTSVVTTSSTSTSSNADHVLDKVTTVEQPTKNQLKRQQKQTRKQKKQVQKPTVQSSNSQHMGNGAKASANDEVAMLEGSSPSDEHTEPHAITAVTSSGDDLAVNMGLSVGELNGEHTNQEPSEQSDTDDDNETETALDEHVDKELDSGAERQKHLKPNVVYGENDRENIIEGSAGVEYIENVSKMLQRLSLESENSSGINHVINVDKGLPVSLHNGEMPDNPGDAAHAENHNDNLYACSDAAGNLSDGEDGHNSKLSGIIDPIDGDCRKLSNSDDGSLISTSSMSESQPASFESVKLHGDGKPLSACRLENCMLEAEAGLIRPPSSDEFSSDSFMERHDHSRGMSLRAPTPDCELTERRHRAMLAAMETAGVRQKPRGKECSLSYSLLQFTAVETLSGNNMLACSTCNSARQKTNEPASESCGANGGQKVSPPVLTCADKQLLIYTPPAVLTLHLKRFQQIGYNLRKNTQHVVFTELLDLAPFCSALCEKLKRSASGQPQILYSLYGVIEHSGTLRSGHYTAYVKVRCSDPAARQFLQSFFSGCIGVDDLVNRMQSKSAAQDSNGASQNGNGLPQNEGRWYHISDTSVSEVRSVENVLNCQAYILFYERIA